MRYHSLAAASGLLLALATPAFAEHGGDREPAGGAFMSSYSRGPYGGDGRFAAPQSNLGFGRTDEPTATGSVGRTEQPRRRTR